VPRRATMATNVLSGSGDLVLLFNQTGLPAGGQPGDVVVDSQGAGAGEFLVLNTNLPPKLIPGQRYYLGVANFNPTETNSFTISVAFDRIDTNLISVIALTNGVSVVNTVGVTNAIDYYQFTVSSNATSVRFDLLPANGNVDLVVRKATQVPDPLPRPNPGDYDYISANFGISPDQIVVTTGSQPVPLAPGVWYVGVYNVDVIPVTYTLTATESTNNVNQNVIVLTNAVPLNFTIGAGSAMTNFFAFDVTQTNSAALFELYNLSDDADLLLNYNDLPTQTLWVAEQLGSPLVPAQIVIRTNSGFPLINGRWYLAVDNIRNVNLSFTVRATDTSTNGMLISGLPLTVVFNPGTPPYTSVDFGWNSVVGETYSVETSTDLVTWTQVAIITASNVVTAYSDPIDPAQPALFYRVRQIP